jgi:hypothetical protein
MELHNKFNCYTSIDFNSESFENGLSKFYETNHFLIFHNIVDDKWDLKIKLEEIYKKLILLCRFDPNNKNIIIVYDTNKKIYLPNNKYTLLPPGGALVYDSSKIRVFF